MLKHLSYTRRLSLTVGGFTFVTTLVAMILVWFIVENSDADDDYQQQLVLQQGVQAALTLTDDLLAPSTQPVKAYGHGFIVTAWRDGTQPEPLNYPDDTVLTDQDPEHGIHYRIEFHKDLLMGLRDETEDFIYILSAVALSTILSSLGSVLLARRLARPVIRLRRQVEQTELDREPLKPMSRDDEVGELSRAFAAQTDRLRSFIAREQAFTRFASHELRSPVTVIRGNLDLLEQTLTATPLNLRILHRLDNSTTRISRLIETFLWLGRENKESSTLPSQTFDDADLNELMGELTLAFSSEDRARLQLQIEPLRWEDIRPALLSIVIDNLIRNALIHSPNPVLMRADNSGIVVENDIDADFTDETQNGFGLQIVEKICEATHWQYEVIHAHHHYRVVLNLCVADAQSVEQ